MVVLVLMAVISYIGKPTKRTAAHLPSTWLNVSQMSGKPDCTPISRTDFKQALYELQGSRSNQTASVSSSTQRPPYTMFATPRNNLRHRVPLSLLHWDREIPVVRRDTTAATLSESIVTSNVTIFAFSPIRPVTYRGEYIELKLSQDDFFEVASPSNTIANLFIDAGDGLGWTVLQTGESVPVSYAETGTKTLRVAAELADGQMLFAAAALEVAALTTVNPTTTIELTTSFGLTGVVTNVNAMLYVLKAPGNLLGYQPSTQTFAKSSSRLISGTGYSTYSTQLRSPVLICEGFDMDNKMDWDDLYNILNKEGLAEELGSLGRDLLVLDFGNATRDIFENAAVATLAVEYTTWNRMDSTDKFTVIGASMGGLVTRIALKKIEDNPSNFLLDSQNLIDTWISFDSPQTGANIPLGIQEFCDFFGYVATQTRGGTFYDPIYQSLIGALEFKQYLDTPAARQMLIAHQSTTTIPSTSYQAFFNSLAALGYPSVPKRIAICNGAGGNIRQTFQPGEQIVNWYYSDFWEVDIYAKIYALPQSYSTPATVFYGRLNPFDIFFNTYDWISTVNANYIYSIDNAPGGTRPSFSEMYDQIPANYKNSTLNYCHYDSHCFIPTVSALGMPIYLCNYAPNNYISSYSPFDETHTAVTNEPHIDINTNNKNWFVKAILENTDADGNGLDDWKQYTSTKTTPIPVPYDWLISYGMTNNFEEVAMADSDGDGYSVWQEFVAGTDPTNILSLFAVTYYDQVNLLWSPDLPDRIYTVAGKTNLSDSAWVSPTNNSHHYFKVRVEMP